MKRKTSTEFWDLNVEGLAEENSLERRPQKNRLFVEEFRRDSGSEGKDWRHMCIGRQAAGVPV